MDRVGDIVYWGEGEGEGEGEGDDDFSGDNNTSHNSSDELVRVMMGGSCLSGNSLEE